ncbi:DUF1367 family protein [Mesorhizobium sp. M0028]|uniref:hypothetical protein n=1 Tax=Mesorhizobium sp. M0028 TaxID=2956849 RepID=UPI00333D68BB
MTSKAAFRHDVIAGMHCLVPCDADGLEMLLAMKRGKEVLTEIHTPRNVRHHRMLFLLMRHVIDGGAWEGDEETLLDWIKYAVGHVKTSIDHLGKVHYVPKSIAFVSMDQAAFLRFFERAVFAICHRLLDDAEGWEKLRDEIIEIVDGRYASQANHMGRAA